MSAVLDRKPMRIETLRQPPHYIEAEQSVLGGLMLVPAAWDKVAERIGEEDFYRRSHRLIFRAIADLAGHGKPFDAITLGDWFERNGMAEEVGGAAYIVGLANATPGASNIVAYADIVRDKSVRRKLIEVATEVTSRAFGNEGETPELLAEAIGALMAMQKNESCAEYTLRQAMSLAYKAAQEAKALGGRIPGIPSGLYKLDHLLGGFHDSDLVVVGARPAMGKTALLLKFALACGVPCGIISAEQPAQQLGSRVLSAESNVNAMKFRNGAFDHDDIGRLRLAAERLVDRTCLIYDRSKPSIADVNRIARKWKQTHGIRILFVDYLQRIDSSHADKRAQRSERVGEVASGLKTIARDLNIPVVSLAQVARKVEERVNKRPNMGDMSDSSEIEKEADQIITLYREAVYYEGTNEKGKPVRENVAELNVEKNRHGPIGYVECAWLGETMRFEDLSHED